MASLAIGFHPQGAGRKHAVGSVPIAGKPGGKHCIGLFGKATVKKFLIVGSRKIYFSWDYAIYSPSRVESSFNINLLVLRGSVLMPSNGLWHHRCAGLAVGNTAERQVLVMAAPGAHSWQLRQIREGMLTGIPVGDHGLMSEEKD